MSCEPWPIVGCEAITADPEVLEAAQSAAQQFLNAITGGRLGVCELTQRYQVRRLPAMHCGPQRRPDGGCCAIPLERVPVLRVVEVLVDGVEIDPSAYTIVGGNKLVRAGCWPSSDDCEPGRVVVTYEGGIPLRPAVYDDSDPDNPVLVTPASQFYGMAATAMGEVTREYVEGMCGRPCKLPSRFVQVSRQGVSLAGLDPVQFLRLGITGMPFTDNLVRTMNPNGLRRKSRVIDIDGPRRW